MLRFSKITLFVMAGAVMLSGCDRAREVMGLNRNKPDEFTVMDRAPLTLPPDYGELPTPDPGANRPQEVTPRERARQAIMTRNIKSGQNKGNQTARGKESSTEAPVATFDTSEKTVGEIAVLEKAGARSRDPNIRKKIDHEAKVGHKDESFIRDLLSIENKATDDVIDAEEEHERLTGKRMPGDEE